MNEIPNMITNNTAQTPVYTSTASASVSNTQTNNVQKQQQNQVPTLEENLKHLQEKWTNEIAEMNAQMKSLQKLDDLLGVIYTKRQEAVDYYHGINTVILKQSKEYKIAYNQMVATIRMNGLNGIRLQEAAIQRHVEGELIDKKSGIEQLSNHNNFIKETIQTIDNMIYGINQKIKLAEILNGLKF